MRLAQPDCPGGVSRGAGFAVGASAMLRRRLERLGCCGLSVVEGSLPSSPPLHSRTASAVQPAQLPLLFVCAFPRRAVLGAGAAG